MAALTLFGCFIRYPRTSGEWDPIHRNLSPAASRVTANCRSVTDSSNAVPVERWRAACYRRDAAAADVGMHRGDRRIEPQAQQVTTRVLRRIAVVESGTRVQD